MRVYYKERSGKDVWDDLVALREEYFKSNGYSANTIEMSEEDLQLLKSYFHGSSKIYKDIIDNMDTVGGMKIVVV